MQFKKGFTLMELLTVMLIVGILSGIAIPQYRKMVEKSHFTKAEVMAKSLRDSCERMLSEYGALVLTDVPEAKRKLAALDIGENILLPRGFVLDPAEEPTQIKGEGFNFSLTNTDGKDGCSVLMEKVSGKYSGVTILYNGNELICSENDEACEVFGLD